MKKYDYILAGGGCAGLSLVYHLLESSLKESQILIIDPNQGEIPNKTWCYWSKEALPIHPQSARFSWNSFYLKDKAQQLTKPLNELSYHHLNSHDFYAHVLEKIRQFPNVHFLKEEVVALTPTGTEIQVTTHTADSYNASFVFDSRVESNDSDQSILKQVFIGIRIKVSEPLFDPKKWGLMDFETRSSNGFDFIYTLPFSTHEALIEYTAYTTEERSEEELLKELQEFLNQKYGSIAYDIQFQESGKIPMSTRNFFSAVSPHHIPIGTAAGWTKPSTGYTFAPIQENCAALVASLERDELTSLHFPRKSRFVFYDNILLTIAHRWPKRLPGLFLNLFSSSRPELVFRFLSEKTTFSEEIRLLSGLKFGIFLKGLLRYGSY
jgi:lycopene beta-cyclase